MKFVIFNFITLLLLLFCKCVLCEEEKSTTEQNVVYDKPKTKEKETVMIAKTSLPATTVTSSEKKRKQSKLVCPGGDVLRSFFSLPCKVTKECTQWGNKNMLCCNNRCTKGITAAPAEPVHSPALFGLVERVCPKEYIPEFLEIKQCTADSDCSPRICCPEKMHNGDITGYCRTAEPKLDRIPGVRQLMEPLRLVMSYMQCTPPPPPFLDIFPKECRGSLDCFPNLCCQERGKKYCRPPKRSLLTLITSVAQRIVPSETARDFITRIAS